MQNGQPNHGFLKCSQEYDYPEYTSTTSSQYSSNISRPELLDPRSNQRRTLLKDPYSSYVHQIPEYFSTPPKVSSSEDIQKFSFSHASSRDPRNRNLIYPPIKNLPVAPPKNLLDPRIKKCLLPTPEKNGLEQFNNHFSTTSASGSEEISASYIRPALLATPTDRPCELIKNSPLLDTKSIPLPQKHEHHLKNPSLLDSQSKTTLFLPSQYKDTMTRISTTPPVTINNTLPFYQSALKPYVSTTTREVNLRYNQMKYGKKNWGTSNSYTSSYIQRTSEPNSCTTSNNNRPLQTTARISSREETCSQHISTSLHPQSKKIRYRDRAPKERRLPQSTKFEDKDRLPTESRMPHSEKKIEGRDIVPNIGGLLQSEKTEERRKELKEGRVPLSTKSSSSEKSITNLINKLFTGSMKEDSKKNNKNDTKKAKLDKESLKKSSTIILKTTSRTEERRKVSKDNETSKGIRADDCKLTSASKRSAETCLEEISLKSNPPRETKIAPVKATVNASKLSKENCISRELANAQSSKSKDLMSDNTCNAGTAKTAEDSSHKTGIVNTETDLNECPPTTENTKRKVDEAIRALPREANKRSRLLIAKLSDDGMLMELESSVTLTTNKNTQKETLLKQPTISIQKTRSSDESLDGAISKTSAEGSFKPELSPNHMIRKDFYEESSVESKLQNDFNFFVDEKSIEGDRMLVVEVEKLELLQVKPPEAVLNSEPAEVVVKSRKTRSRNQSPASAVSEDSKVSETRSRTRILQKDLPPNKEKDSSKGGKKPTATKKPTPTANSKKLTLKKVAPVKKVLSKQVKKTVQTKATKKVVSLKKVKKGVSVKVGKNILSRKASSTKAGSKKVLLSKNVKKIIKKPVAKTLKKTTTPTKKVVKKSTPIARSGKKIVTTTKKTVPALKNITNPGKNKKIVPDVKKTPKRTPALRTIKKTEGNKIPNTLKTESSKVSDITKLPSTKSSISSSGKPTTVKKKPVPIGGGTKLKMSPKLLVRPKNVQKNIALSSVHKAKKTLFSIQNKNLKVSPTQLLLKKKKKPFKGGTYTFGSPNTTKKKKASSPEAKDSIKPPEFLLETPTGDASKEFVELVHSPVQLISSDNLSIGVSSSTEEPLNSLTSAIVNGIHKPLCLSLSQTESNVIPVPKKRKPVTGFIGIAKKSFVPPKFTPKMSMKRNGHNTHGETQDRNAQRRLEFGQTLIAFSKKDDIATSTDKNYGVAVNSIADGKSLILPNLGFVVKFGMPIHIERNVVDELLNSLYLEQQTNAALNLCTCNFKPLERDGLKLPESVCQAVDTIDKKSVQCSNVVSNRCFYRAHRNLPFLEMCEIHYWRLKHHQCCPVCGLFCSQGTFLRCQTPDEKGKPQLHFFHEKCLSNSRCPHCGVESNFCAVNISMNSCFTSASESSRSISNKKPASPKSTNDTAKQLTLSQEIQPSIIVKPVEEEFLSKLPEYERHFYKEIRSGNVERVMAVLATNSCGPCHRFPHNLDNTPLHLVAELGFSQIVLLLIQAGACIDSMNAHLSTPLMIASAKKHFEVANCLIQTGADVAARDENGMTAFHLAARSGDMEIIKVLFETQKIDVNIQDNEGRTALVWACEHKAHNVVKWLLENEADPLVRDKEQNVALHWAALSGDSENLKAVCTSWNVDAVNEKDNTALHIASKQGNYDCIVLLLNKGSNVYLKNSEGLTPLMCCKHSDSKSWRILKLFADTLDLSEVSNESSIIIKDLSRGNERNPVEVFRNIKSEEFPTTFHYITSLSRSSKVNLNRNVRAMTCCTCHAMCSGTACTCTISSWNLWYDTKGRLISEFNMSSPPVIFECNRMCSCPQSCPNRIVQHGSRCHFQVFCANGKGWGVRCLRKIKRGTFVAEYIGELISKEEAEDRNDNSYFFDLDNESDGCIDSKKYGNVSHFFNHSCDPNLTAVRVYIDHHDLNYPHVALFSNRDINAGEELCFDYGKNFWLNKCQYFLCVCGSPSCKYSKDSIDHTLMEHYKQSS